MDLQLLPVDVETGEVLEFRPSMIKKLNNSDLTSFLAAVKDADKMKKEAEKEVKKRLDEGQKFTQLSYGKPVQQKILTMTNKQKFDLVTAHGWDCVEPIGLPALKKMLGEGIEQELEQSIVYKEKKRSIKWDV
ncbi:hypothetical protein AALM99_04790 [Lactococcus muris]|uniref:Phage protein n=2 Tax=Lactococcus TaxID=1357 RepID=A0ABV4D7P1_9LACT